MAMEGTHRDTGERGKGAGAKARTIILAALAAGLANNLG
jgi:hypothetical protein